MSTVTSSRVWSCSTLRDGIDQLAEQAQQVDDEEEELMKLIEDWIYMQLYLFTDTGSWIDRFVPI